MGNSHPNSDTIIEPIEGCTTLSDLTKIYDIAMHGRGGQGVITGSLLLCEVAYLDGFIDTLSIPRIGAERRGAAIKAFAKLSKHREIKNYADPEDPDITIIFDPTLLPTPGGADSIKHGSVLINTNSAVNLSLFPPGVKIYTVPVTDISLNLKLLAAGLPILNIPILGALTKVHYIDERGDHLLGLQLETIHKIALEKYKTKGELNFQAAVKAAELTKEIPRGST